MVISGCCCLSSHFYLVNSGYAQIVPDFDNHPLADRPFFMDDNATLHRAYIIREFRQQEVIDTFQWPAISSDMNLIVHTWDFIGRKVNQRNP